MVLFQFWWLLFISYWYNCFLKTNSNEKNCLGMNWKTDIMSDGAKKEKKRKTKLKVNCKLYFMYVSATGDETFILFLFFLPDLKGLSFELKYGTNISYNSLSRLMGNFFPSSRVDPFPIFIYFTCWTIHMAGWEVNSLGQHFKNLGHSFSTYGPTLSR